MISLIEAGAASGRLVTELSKITELKYFIIAITVTTHEDNEPYLIVYTRPGVNSSLIPSIYDNLTVEVIEYDL